MRFFLAIFLLSYSLSSQPIVNIGKNSINFGLYPKNPNSPYTWSDVGHYYGSVAMTVGFGLIAYRKLPIDIRNRKFKACIIGGGASLFIGIFGKEIVYDKWMNKGVPSLNDAILDFSGSGAGMLGLRVGFEIHELRLDKKANQVRKVKRIRHDNKFSW